MDSESMTLHPRVRLECRGCDCCRFPAVLTCSMAAMNRCLACLQQVGLDRDQIRRVVRSFPNVGHPDHHVNIAYQHAIMFERHWVSWHHAGW